MNTTNFPGNTKKKRQGALDRLKKQLANGCKPKGNPDFVKAQIAILEAKLKGDVS